MIETIIGLIFHLDQNLSAVVQSYGIWTYLILFCIIFFETGFVIMPFLPGDSLLFVSGAAAASGIMNLEILIAAVILGAVTGDTVNYWLGNYLGLHIFQKRFPNFIKKVYIDKTNGFYDKYGGATIFVARFVPLVRTFAPFLAGVGAMKYRRFLLYNVLGAVSWTLVVVLSGYYLGTFSIVKENMSLLILLVLAVTAGTILLILAGLIQAYRQKKRPEGQ
ncbi:VTT domain-containing protein [Methanoregula sp.]|jgi:membrane-associated protein|uniref:VTT domain-containing protein n=1 Tax=Methanoregula sp. TaxID=2052170 RepID=UPI0025EC3AEA|nr:VTT domain-containing protein [Methanoregula sp.]